MGIIAPGSDDNWEVWGDAQGRTWCIEHPEDQGYGDWTNRSLYFKGSRLAAEVIREIFAEEAALWWADMSLEEQDFSRSWSEVLLQQVADIEIGEGPFFETLEEARVQLGLPGWAKV